MAMASCLKLLATVATVLLVVQRANGVCLPLEDCTLQCQYGLAYDKNECHICACLEPCKGYDCGPFEMCEVRTVQCFRAPCPPVATCVPKSSLSTVGDMSTTTTSGTVDDCLLEPSKGLCSGFFSRWFFNVTTLKCQTFTYSGCGGNDNNFDTEEACLARCLPTSVGCPIVSCASPCQLQFDDKGCNVCACPGASCKDVSCPLGEECQMVSGQCATVTSGVCHDRPQCLPATGVSSSPRPCPYIDCELMICEHGFKLDNNGCKTCSCYDPCETFSCPENQRCLVLPSDCGEEEECRDGPMRICTDVTTVPAVIRNRPSAEELLSCCKSGNMSSECESICVSNLTVTSSSVPALLRCAGDLNTYFKCIGTGQSFTSCCERKGVSGSCHDFCAGSGRVDTSNMHIFTQCLMSNDMNAVFQCYQDGAADTTTVITTSTSQGLSTPNRVSDICILVPDPGPCQDIMERWFYNYTDKTCQKFQYHGCLGNGNNFLTQEECTAACKLPKPNCPEVICDANCHVQLGSSGCNTCVCSASSTTRISSTSQISTTQSTSTATSTMTTRLSTTQPTTKLDTTTKPDIISSTTTVTKPSTTLVTKSSTATPISAQLQLTSCCDEQGVSETCLPFCSFRPEITEAMLPALLSCDKYMATGLQCAKRNQTFTECCRNAGVMGECLNGCGKQMIISDHDCLRTYFMAMSQCFESGVPDTPCPQVRCEQRCQYGQQKDEAGCNTCNCDDPCKTLNCPSGQVCSYTPTPVCDDDVCDIAYVGYCAKKSDCPVLNCNNCTYGFMKDNNGCSTCQCSEPCKNVTCEKGFSCQVTTSVSCQEGVCQNKYTGSCAVECRPVMCRMFCEYGWALNSDGCEVCQCHEPCKDIQCGQGQRCVPSDVPVVIGKEGSLKQVYIGQCHNVCDTLNCALKCEYGLKKNSKNCDECACYEPCQNVTCEVGSRCIPTASDVTTTNPYDVIGICLPSPQCSDVMCMMYCDYGFMKDDNGCPMCHCYEPCQGVTCDSGLTCQLSPATELTSKYDIVGVCRNKTVCGDLAMCMMYCTHGFKKDAHGCDVCQCYDPCENVTCGMASVCQPKAANVTDIQPYEYISECVRCTGMLCRMALPCNYGIRLVTVDCPLCECFDPCKDTECESGFQCEAVETSPDEGSLQSYKGVCKAVCSPVMCLMYCPHGFVKDSNGCDICRCYDPCENVTCDSMSVCQPKATNVTDLQPYEYTSECVRCTGMLCRMACPHGMVQLTKDCSLCQCFDPCKDAQCKIGSKCIVTETTPEEESLQSYKGVCQDQCKPVACNMYCKYGMVKDSNGCNTCYCYDPCKNVSCDATSICHPSKVNTTEAQQYKYEAQCVRCSGMLCDISCRYGTVMLTEDCPLCQCFDPCQDVECDEDEVCKVESVDSDSSLQKYKGVCSGGCSKIMCTMFCPNGMMKDKNGCDICMCYEPCQGITCDKGLVCVAEEVNMTSVDKYNLKGVCKPFPGCAEVMCSNDCVHGYAKDSMGCTICDCANPCIAATCPLGSSCQVTDDPDCAMSPCPPIAVCVDHVASCTEQQALYKKMFENDLGNMPELNCDHKGEYKPLQCSGRGNSSNLCSCVSKKGQVMQSGMSMQQAILTCYRSSPVLGSMRINANFSIIQPGNGSQFKHIMSSEIANLIGVDESDVTVTMYRQGSILVDFIVSEGTINTDRVMQEINDLEDEEFYVSYDGGSYPARILYSSIPDPPLTAGPYDQHDHGRKAFLLKVILIPILGTLALVLIIIGIVCCCKMYKRKSELLPNSARSSRSFDSIVDHIDPKMQKGYDNPTYSVAKVTPTSEKLSIGGSTAA